MFEKLYIRLLRLYPPKFRKEYGEEALQLIQERLRDEVGFFERARLWWDLVTDLLDGLPQAHRNTYAATEAMSFSPNADGIPFFRVLNKEPLRRGSILAGGTVSLTAVAVFGLMLSRPVASLPTSPSNGPMSPIESVVERLNRATTPDSALSSAQEAAEAASTGAPEQQPGSWPAATASASKPETPTLQAKSKRGGSEQDRIAPIQTENSNEDSAFLVEFHQPSKAMSESEMRRSFSINSKAAVNDQAINFTASSSNSNSLKDRSQSLIPSGQPQLENASSAMIRLFQTHDIVMFGEVHDSEQEYEWLCELVKTPGFADQVDDIVVEFGNPLYQETVDRYVAGENVPFDEVQKAWRNMVADAEPVSPVYGWLYKAVRETNLEHPGQHGIRLLMGSPPGDWSKINNSADLAPYLAERDQWYEQIVKEEVLAKHHHALLIMGAGHFLRGHGQALQLELAAQQHRVVPIDREHLDPGNIESGLRASGANPYLVVFGTNTIDSRGDVDKRFDSWPAPVIVPLSGAWVGALPAQPVLSGGHAPPIPLTLADQADALLYVAPCSVLQTVHLSKAEIEDTSYGQEMIRRDMILLGHPATFPYGTQPQCVQPQEALR
jgi:hypothetical protein